MSFRLGQHPSTFSQNSFQSIQQTCCVLCTNPSPPHPTQFTPSVLLLGLTHTIGFTAGLCSMSPVRVCWRGGDRGNYTYTEQRSETGQDKMVPGAETPWEAECGLSRRVLRAESSSILLPSWRVSGKGFPKGIYLHLVSFAAMKRL